MDRSLRAAAIQLEAVVADLDANLRACERLTGEAAAAGAELIVLPEFFPTAIGFVPELAKAALPVDGPATAFLFRMARRHETVVGGSFLCRDGDGNVRNAFLLVEPDGTVAGRHDKDLPTMWEHSFYIGGADDGVITLSTGLRVGVAMCWELMRTSTVRRLRGQVDLVVAASCWWSQPVNWPPRTLARRIETRNCQRARRAAAEFARYVGAPVVHAAHAGRLNCRMPETRLCYEGHFEGAALITDAAGTVLGERHWSDGAGVIVADVQSGRRRPALPVPDRSWLHPRGLLAATAWHTQRLHGRRRYRSHVKG